MNVECNLLSKKRFHSNTQRKDGLLIKIHHTIPDSTGIRRIKFIQASFSHTEDKLAAVDQKGNIFVIDFESRLFWIVLKIRECTLVSFNIFNEYTILIGKKSGDILLINIETGNKKCTLKGHTDSIKHISFSKGNICLTSSNNESIIWDLSSNTQVHILTLGSDISIKYAFFIPISNDILVCFKNDIIHVWRYKTFEPIKQILPSVWKNFQIKSIAFTRNGRTFILAGRSHNLEIFSTDLWTLNRTIKLPSHIEYVRHMEFIPQTFDGGSNKILALLSNDYTVYFYDAEENMFLNIEINSDKEIIQFTCSNNGKYLSCLTHFGEIKIFIISTLLQNVFGDKLNVTKSFIPIKVKKSNIEAIKKEIETTLSMSELRPILKQYLQYPNNYRQLIWKTILKLPNNQNTFNGLIKRGQHIVCYDINKKYSLENKTVLRDLSIILSCLANWCPLFGQVENITLLLFPFVKYFQNNQIICFEIICTVIINWCQFWFEYFPLPPLNILAIVENILADKDPDLFDHIQKNGITSQLYAWSLLETIFSEVLTKDEWLKLWDHLFSNEPHLILISVVAYSIHFRSTLFSLNSLEQFDYFYHNQNAINMTAFISKIYSLNNVLTDELHPKQYLKKFLPLSEGTYPIYTQYPKIILDHQSKQKEQLLEEQRKLEIEEMRVIEEKAEYLKNLKISVKQDEENIRLENLQKLYKDTLRDEEERLAFQRKKLSMLRNEIREKEQNVLSNVVNSTMQRKTIERSKTLECLLNDLTYNRTLQEDEIAQIEDEISEYHRRLLNQKYELEKQLHQEEILQTPIPEHTALQKQHKKLKQQLNKIHTKNLDTNQRQYLELVARITALDDVLQQVEIELAKEMAARQSHLIESQNNLRLIELELQTKNIESNIKTLLDNLAIKKVKEVSSKASGISQSYKDRHKLNSEQKYLLHKLTKKTI